MATTTMIEPSRSAGRPVAADAIGARNLTTDRHAGNRELLARAVVGLHQHAQHGFGADAPARRADAALESMRHHPRAAADVALGDRTGPRPVERLEHVRLRHVLAEAVVQERIGGFPDDGLMPGNLPLRATS